MIERYIGCLLGGAVGDAMGAPVEFLTRAEILSQFGPAGVTTYAPAYGGIGTITDDTQMTLFTAEGLLRAWVRGRFKGISTPVGVTAHAYLRWLHTQGEASQCPHFADQRDSGWLVQLPALHCRRAPGMTCLNALREMRVLGQPAANDSKGCGGVMRMAPVGLFLAREGQTPAIAAAFALGTKLAALTHGHPSGSLSAGVLAALVIQLVAGESLGVAVAAAKAVLITHRGHEETLAAIEAAQAFAAGDLPAPLAIAELGQGWVAEEALAIALYCVLVAGSFREAVLLAVNHDGDSDSTGAIAGNLSGARDGLAAIPPEWLAPLELRDVIREIAEDLYARRDWDIGEYSADEAMNAAIWAKYPGF